MNERHGEERFLSSTVMSRQIQRQNRQDVAKHVIPGEAAVDTQWLVKFLRAIRRILWIGMISLLQ